MNMARADNMPDQAVIACIQKVNKTNTTSNNQSEQTYGLLQVVINGTGTKK